MIRKCFRSLKPLLKVLKVSSFINMSFDSQRAITHIIQKEPANIKKRLMIVIFDGFRKDFLDQYKLSNLKRFQK